MFWFCKDISRKISMSPCQDRLFERADTSNELNCLTNANKFGQPSGDFARFATNDKMMLGKVETPAACGQEVFLMGVQCPLGSMRIMSHGPT
jgi:hypothetical protein